MMSLPLDAIELQVVVGALRAACEEMGATLVRSARSPNIKERRDASTALFDAAGEMVMQAEHIPVHLGSMPAAVRAVLEHEQHEGVSWVLNDPFAGGTHLPDITVVTPVFTRVDERARPRERAQAQKGDPLQVSGRAQKSASEPTQEHERPALIGFAASRAHHADVGGRVPGSMPADSRTLAEEGVVISPRPLTDAALEQIVAQMRNPRERRADLRAQLAANHTGARRLGELAARIGVERLRQAMDEVLDYAERRTRACIAALPDGAYQARDVLEAVDGDLELRLRAVVDGERLLLDFSGSAPRHEGNLNCPLAVTLSACWFAVRVLTDPDIPPSAGAYRPVEVVVPEGTLLNARRSEIPAPAPDGAPRARVGGPPVPASISDRSNPDEPAPAVAAGNVETSSRVADLVLRAFGRALGQGTMNNLTLGNDDFTYYETIGGGQGACPDADGPSGVHVTMSNTLNTPVEALERELPLRVVEYALRRGSGGAGAHRGGDGVVRALQARGEMTYSLIAERRRHAPPGAAGGEPGAPGRDAWIAADTAKVAPGGHTASGETRRLPGKSMGTLRPGERLRIETPGGGGHGNPPDRATGEPPTAEPPTAEPVGRGL
jgi:N-methylhydantoinase B